MVRIVWKVVMKILILKWLEYCLFIVVFGNELYKIGGMLFNLNLVYSISFNELFAYRILASILFLGCLHFINKKNKRLKKMTIQGYVNITVETKHITTNAILVDYGGDKAVWIPKSGCEDWPDIGKIGTLIVSEYWAVQKGMV